MQLTAEQRISKWKVMLGRDKPFFGYLIYLLKCSEMPKEMEEAMKAEGMAPTMGVDQNANAHFSRAFIESISDDEGNFVLVHEVMHVALSHLSRMGLRDRLLWNIVTDLVINTLLKQEGTFRIPAQCVVADGNDSFKIGGKTITNVSQKIAEQIYDELPIKYVNACNGKCSSCQHNGKNKGNGGGGNSNKNGKNGNSNGNGGSGSGKNGKPGNSGCPYAGTGMVGKGYDYHIHGQSNPQKEQEWKEQLATAAANARQRGTLPAHIQRLVDKVLEPRINWRQILWQMISNELPYDTTWARPSRRSASTGIYLPSMVKEKVSVVVHIDTSGSIGDDDLREFLGEIVGIGRSFAQVEMHVIICDAKVHETYDLTSETISHFLNTKIKGGGGTSHRPVYEYLEKEKPNTKLLISFTDAYSDYPETEEVPTLFVVCSNGSLDCLPKWGRSIQVQKKY